MKSLLLLTLVLAACWASDPFFDDVPLQPSQEVLDSFRLPDNVKPIEYNIELKPNFESSERNKNFTFEGTSTIILNITNTNTIIFHAKNLTFLKDDIKLTYIEKNKTTTLNVHNFSEDKRKDFVTLTFEKNLTTINANLFLHYNGTLNDGLRGFYRSSYKNKEEKKTWLATTHFEPVSARQAFPCWDEPQFKAKFTINITVPENNTDYKAISNMPINEEKKSEKGKTVFKQTPNMSSYLVAFVVSDFTARQNKNQTNYTVWAKPTIEESATKFALDYGSEVLKEMGKFTNKSYKEDLKMEKMDQIAIPDLSVGAMENWGLVTYKESELFYIENKTTTENKQGIATIIAHEFAHQWFGNLVTCKWWDYIWLNEGFATFFQYYISNKISDSKSWRLMEQFVIKNVQESSFVIDASSKTRPLNPKVSVQTPDQIYSLFDDVAYKKGASILHMMYGFLSEDVFRAGLRKYLSDHQSGSVDTSDFFKSLQNIENNTMKDYLPENVQLEKVMNNWVNEAGYPVITVTSIRIKEKAAVNITQERFFLVKPAKEDKTKWYIPINYVTEDAPNSIMPENKQSRWMTPENSKIIENLNDTKWILFNKNRTGYYRVNYDESNWQRLATYLSSSNYKTITEVDRAGLIDDALNLARTGHLTYNVSLKMTLYLTKEDDYIPWYAAARAFNYLDNLLLLGKNYEAYRKYVASKIKHFHESIFKVSDHNSTHVNKLSKVLALNTACKYGLKECEDFVNKKLTEWLEFKNSTLPTDLRSGILCAGLRNANASTWNTTLEKYKDSKDEDEKADILAGLACTSDEKSQKVLLDSTVAKNPIIKIFDAMNAICAGNPKSFTVLVNFINANIGKIQEADKADNSLLIALFNKLSDRVQTIEQYEKLTLLVHWQLANGKVEGLASAIHNLVWIKTHRDEVEKWILQNCEVCQNDPGSASAITLTSLLLAVTLLLTRLY